jgi:hypothetical protein
VLRLPGEAHRSPPIRITVLWIVQYAPRELGATHFVPSGSGLNQKTYFSLSLGGGAKIPISGHVGLRLEGRGFLTILPDTTEIFCVSSDGAACNVKVQGDVFVQLLLMAGITFSL